MADRARFDQNNRTSLIGVSNADGITPVSLWADPSTHSLLISGSFSAGTLSNNNAAPAANNQGVLPALANAAAPSYTEGNQVLLSTDLAGALRVTGSLSIGGTTDNSAYTAGASSGTPAFGFYHSVIDTVTDGRAAAIAITPKRAMHSNLRDATGAELGIAAAPLQVSLANTAANATAIKVDGSAVNQPVTLTSTTITGSVTVVGGKTNNNAVPGANNIGALVGIANAAAPTYTEGDQVLLSTDLTGQLRITGSLSVGGTTDNSAFTAGTSTGTPSMGFYHATIDAVTDGRAAALAIDSKRNLHVSLFDAAGNARAANVTAANELLVNVNNAIALAAGAAVIGHVIVDSGAIAATLSAETTKVIGVVRTADGAGNLLLSAANALNSTGAGILAAQMVAQFDDASPTAITENQFGNVRMSTNRSLYMNIRDGAGNERALNVAASGNISIDTVTTVTTVSAVTAITNALPAGSAVIGKVSIDQTTPGTTNLVALTAETTKVIGVVRNSDGAGNLLTSNSTTFTAKFGLDVNILGTLGTAFSTAGKVDVKGADGDVFVRQATGTNLHAVIDSGTISTITNVVHVDDNSGSLTVDSAALTTADLDTGAGTDTRGVMGVALGKSGGALILAAGQVAMASSLPVVIASDQTSIPVAATLSAETTKVIGVTRTADGAGNLLTSNSTTFTAKFGLDVNILGTLGTAFTTAGFVDIKGADGNVFVRQATASNLNATVVGTGTFAVQNTPVAPATIFNGSTNVATAGSRVTLAASQAVQSVTIKAKASNTGTIYVGSSAVSSANGFQLAAGESVSMDVANLNTVNLDSSVNGEGVTYIAIG